MPETYEQVELERDRFRQRIAELEAELKEAQTVATTALKRELELKAENERLSTNKWLQMENAPKDGTRIILDWGGKARVGFYLDNSASQVPWQGWRVPSMEACPRNESPKYWMPMPDAAMEGK